ncbi:hypothetical protein ACFYPC_27000 [Streptomyces sp. NPDC005808]|uniref:hypothetical protein n=1 Tax=Streptomyces sp. NPDC005808 TaxID=3364734 RepID=UPI00367F42A1
MTSPVAVIVDAASYAQAVEDAMKAAAGYYAGGTSVLDDDAYDRLVRGIAAWEADHPAESLGIRLAEPDEFAALVADYLDCPRPTPRLTPFERASPQGSLVVMPCCRRP